jgi:hypothetical protein
MSVYIGYDKEAKKEIWWNGTIDQWNTANKSKPAAADKASDNNSTDNSNGT